MELSFWERLKIRLKLVVSYLFHPVALLIVYGVFYGLLRCRIRNLAMLRKQFAEIVKTHQGKPILICPNHLTWVDSVIFQIAVLPPWKVFTNYRQVPWHVLDPINLPYLCPVIKTMPIERMGDRKRVELVKEKISYLIRKGDLVVIFPEGARSDTGRVNVEGFQYGAGDILRAIPTADVLCVYIRGDNQIFKSKLPNKGAIVDVEMKVIHPTTTFEGLRASRDIATQIINTLRSMEEGYFASSDHR